jgi:hypothetical protein
MDIVLLSHYGCKTAFKITTAMVLTLEDFIDRWELNRFPSQVWVTTFGENAKAKRLSAALIRKEYPQYMDSDYYRNINY